MNRKLKKRKSTRSKDLEINFLERLRTRCPDDAKILKALGDLYTSVGRVDEGLEVDMLLCELCPAESEVWYNLGCSYALAGRKEEAFGALSRALELGYEDIHWMREDADLESLRGDPRFGLLLERARS